eukprot:3973234-Pleurochrysis_carterae.AAC.3
MLDCSYKEIRATRCWRVQTLRADVHVQQPNMYACSTGNEKEVRNLRAAEIAHAYMRQPEAESRRRMQASNSLLKKGTISLQKMRTHRICEKSKEILSGAILDSRRDVILPLQHRPDFTATLQSESEHPKVRTPQIESKEVARLIASDSLRHEGR